MLVILTLIQISIPLENRSIDIIRQIRILRYGYFRLMLKSVYKTLAGIYEYVLLMLIVLYIFTLLGIQMFIEELPDSIRDNFNSFQNSFFTAFKVLVGENWNEIMYHVVLKTNRWSVLYFVIFMILGQFIMVNLLLAIIISEFNQSRLINTKLKAIDNIKYQLDKGKTIKRAIELVLGLDFYNKLFIDEESNKLCLKRSTIVRGKTMNRRPSLSSDSQNKEINPFDFIRSGYPLVYRSEKYLEVLRSSRFHNGQSSSRSMMYNKRSARLTISRFCKPQFDFPSNSEDSKISVEIKMDPLSGMSSSSLSPEDNIESSLGSIKSKDNLRK